MYEKSILKAKKIDFKLASPQEINDELARRLRIQRLLKNLKQQDLANMAGVSVGTVKNLEAKGQSSLESFIRIVMALNLQSELSTLFQTKVNSIEQMEKIEKLTSASVRKRAR